MLPQPHPPLPLYFPITSDSNLIERIEGIHHNSALQLLSLSRNRISELSGLDHLVRLRYLYLSMAG